MCACDTTIGHEAPRNTQPCTLLAAIALRRTETRHGDKDEDGDEDGDRTETRTETRRGNGDVDKDEDDDRIINICEV